MSLDGGLELKRAEWREKALAGTLADEEMRQWIEMVRGGRMTAATTSATSRARKAPPDIGAMLDELDSL